MIFIAAKFRVRPGSADQWLEDVAEFTAATRAEPGNLFFEWSRDVEDPSTFVLLEGFRDDAAGAHVQSEHFRTAMATLGAGLVERPHIVNASVPGETWSRLGEIQMED